MSKRSRANLISFVVSLIITAGCSNSSDNPITSSVDLLFSDAAVDNATEVVITVNKITFRPANGNDDIVVETFNGSSTADEDMASDESTNEASEQEPNGVESNDVSDTFTIDLLTVKGTITRLVLDDVELPVGEYSSMLLEVIDEDITKSFVMDEAGMKPLKVPSQVLKLGGFTITPNSTQSMVVEFGLQQSMTYNPGPDRYILKPRGVRIVSVEEAANVSGSIDPGILQSFVSCEATNPDGTIGSLYLYEGHDLDKAKLADNFDAVQNTEQSELISPIASASLSQGSGNYVLSFLEPGNYTMGVSCHTESDDADLLDGFGILINEKQYIEISLTAGESLECNIPLEDGACGL